MESESIKGLSTEEVKVLREKYGYNQLVKEEKPSPFKKFFGVFKEPMFLLLVGTSIIYFLLGEPREAFVMLIFVSFVATITFVQEWKTEKTLNALKELTSPHITVLRDGRKATIKSTELLPGDIIYLSEGERIPADCEILEVSNFSVDESILTGESEHVMKGEGGCLYAGTLSIFGKCTARVDKIGLETEYGKISKAVSEAKEELTPLQKKTESLVKSLAIVGFVLCLLVIGLSYIYSKKIIESILAGITLAMAIIPEEFPVVLTIFLSLGAFRLAKKNALMRRISAVETLGAATVLCVDKTGTITKNLMEVKKVFCNDKIVDKDELRDENLKKLMALSCEKDPYDPMEKAIVKESKIKNDYPISKKIPFSSNTKMMANIYKTEEGYYVAAKGSPEAIIPLCNLGDKEEINIIKLIDKMASEGLRVLAFADSSDVDLKEEIEDYKMNFRGLVALQDPPKEGVEEAIKLCKKAGIRVLMITGDYSKTAVAIGKEIGLEFKNCAITGEDIDKMTEEELCEAVKHCDIFSRVIPEHKMKIVNALKKNGEIVAMTGDGVNDAPALKNAHIGIAMGKRGTEVAKEAAHMVLMDDNFTTIVNSVKDGRRIFDNIRKAMVYIMVIHIPIASIALLSPVFNLPQLLLPVHIVILELIIDPTCSIIFEGEEAEPYIMERSPRSPKEPLLTKRLTIKVISQGIIMFLAAFMPFHYLVDEGYKVEMARSFSLMTLIVSNVILVLVNRSNRRYLIDIFKESKNIARLLINSLALVMVFLVVYLPSLQPIFKTAPINPKLLFLSLVLGVASGAWYEIVKLFNRS